MPILDKPFAAALFGTIALAVAPAHAQYAPRIAATRLSPDTIAQTQSPLGPLMARARAPAATQPVVAHLNLPYGIALDPAGNLYVANVFGNNVAIYNVKHVYQGAITSNMSSPTSVAIDDEGNVVVLNNGSDTINTYTPTGTQLSSITDPTLSNGTSLVCDPDDTLWALDATGMLHGYLADGTVLPPLASGGTAVGVWGPNVAIWGIQSAGSSGYSEGIDSRATAVRDNPQIDSLFPSAFPLAGAQATDGNHLQYVTDAANNQVEIWNGNGSYESPVATFPVPSEPIGIAVDTMRHRIYVAFPNLNEVIVYSTVAPYDQLAIIH